MFRKSQGTFHSESGMKLLTVLLMKKLIISHLIGVSFSGFQKNKVRSIFPWLMFLFEQPYVTLKIKLTFHIGQCQFSLRDFTKGTV